MDFLVFRFLFRNFAHVRGLRNPLLNDCDLHHKLVRPWLFLLPWPFVNPLKPNHYVTR